MLICQTEFNLCAILTECGGTFYEIRRLKNDIGSIPSTSMVPRWRNSFWHLCVSLEVIKFTIQQIYNSSSSSKE